ncbi:unnamed protein product [Aureobasidium mustum]|uniref:Uncharacterized protein n=1 Tax=Aureobasidium mustum TaxID=2773714 RepID=A0A9N8JND7_9PEZI|nr:unnamed protein product [Aureobasidium mustum]
MSTAKTNPWLDTVLSKTEPSTPSEPKNSPERNGLSDQLRPKSSTPKIYTEKKPAQDSLDEAFQAAIKAIVPERLEATRRAKARMEVIQGTTQDNLKVAEFTQVTSTNPAPTTPKLPKQKEKPLLQAAIEHLTFDRLHTVLYKALNESPKARSVFERELLAPLSPDLEDNEETIAAKKKSGRKRPRFEVCRWCKDEFDVTDNPGDACNHHTGELEPDERAWRDYNVAEDGPIDTDENREIHAEGFTWDCCQADGDDDGCETTAHEIDENYNPKKPKRYWEF